MIAVTIGVGKRCGEEAEAAAETVRWSTGLETIVLHETPGEPVPAAYKLQLLDLWPGESVLYFDADTRFLQRWDVSRYEEPLFVAALDYPSGCRDGDCLEFGINPQRYINTGIWIAHPSHRPALQLAYQIFHDAGYYTRFRYEQTAFNAALQRLHVPLHLLPRRFNVICDPRRAAELPADTVVLHRAGAGAKANGILFRRILDRHIPH